MRLSRGVPNLFVIAGPNGAGKTTYARRFLPEEKDGAFTISDPVGLALIERTASVRFMPEVPPTRVEEPVAMTADWERRASLRALRKAFADAVLENLQFGLPVIQYIDGKTVEVPAEQLAPKARRILEANGEYLPGEEKPSWW